MKYKYTSYLILCILCLLIEIFLFEPIITHLNHAMFTDGGDGIKNYFTYLYYLKWNSGVHFTGMNYPFGENVVFTDNTPLLAWTIKGLGHFFPAINQYGLGILNASLLLSFPIGAIYLFKIQKLFNVPNVWAIVSSLIILFFSPQIFNLSGFFGMAYIMYLPMLIYLLMIYHKEGKIITAFYLLLLTIPFTFIHVYHLVFTIILIGFYSLAYLIIFRHFSFKRIFRHLVPLWASALLAVLSFFGYLKLFDPVTDRTTYPYGVFGAKTDLGDLFTSRISPLGFTFQFLFGKAKGHEEGYVYIGIISIAVVVVLIAYFFRSVYVHIAQKRRIPLHPVRAYRIWLLIAIFELLLSMGVPFKYNLNFWADHVSLLREFRSVGRFSWCFYYIFLTFCSIFLYKLFQLLSRRGKMKLAYSLTTFVVLIWGVQLSGYFQWIKNNIVKPALTNYARFYNDGQLSTADWLAQKGFPAQGFQCIMGLPYFHIGSEKIWLQDNDNGRTMYYCAQLSLRSGLPMTDVQMSRTSWKQTFAEIQLVDGYFAKKPLLKTDYSDKPVLVMVNKHFPLKEKEKEWVDKSKHIGTFMDFDFYAVTPATIINNGTHLRDSMAKIAENRPETEGLIGDTAGKFWTIHFDQTTNFNAFAGAGDYQPQKREENQLVASLTIPANTLKDSVYYFTIWSLCNDVNYRSPTYILKQYNGEGQAIKESYLNTKYCTHVIRNWYLAEEIITFDKNMQTLKIFVTNPIDYIALDEIAIWPDHSVLFYKTKKGRLFLNNRPQ